MGRESQNLKMSQNHYFVLSLHVKETQVYGGTAHNVCNSASTVVFFCKFFNKPAPTQKKLQRKPISITTPYIDL